MEYESKLSDIIATLPEVSGGFLYSSDRGIYSNQSEPVVSDTTLQHVTLKLTKIVHMLAINFHDTNGIRITFKNHILYGMQADEENWLFLFHQPSLSPGMLKMTVQMALNITNDEPIDQFEITEEEEKNDSAALAEELMAPDSELHEALTTIEEELAIQIGPVAELIFDDSLKEWCKTDTPSHDNLPVLIAMLEKEIEDEDDCEAFKKALKAYLGEN